MTKNRQKSAQKRKSESYGTLVFESFGGKSEKRWKIRALEMNESESQGRRGGLRR